MFFLMTNGEKILIILTSLNLTYMMDLWNGNNIEIPYTAAGNTKHVSGKVVALK